MHTRLHQETVRELEPWFHNIHLPDGTQTAPAHFLGDYPAYKWAEIREIFDRDVHGSSILDIGCNAGFYSIKLALRGARVTAVDSNPHYLKQARWASGLFGVKERIEFHQMQIYDLAGWDKQFDTVLFLGVFYHLRYPLLGLDIVSRLTGKRLVFQTMTMPGEEVFEDTADRTLDERDVFLHSGWPKMAFIEHEFSGDRTNWWAANHACVEAMLRSSGLRVTDRPGKEVYVCVPESEHESCTRTWNQEEYLAATGRGSSRQLKVKANSS